MSACGVPSVGVKRYAGDAGLPRVQGPPLLHVLVVDVLMTRATVRQHAGMCLWTSKPSRGCITLHGLEGCFEYFAYSAQDSPKPLQPPASDDVMSLDPDTMDEDSFREGLELMEQLEVRVLHPKPRPKVTLNLGHGCGQLLRGAEVTKQLGYGLAMTCPD